MASSASRIEENNDTMDRVTIPHNTCTVALQRPVPWLEWNSHSPIFNALLMSLNSSITSEIASSPWFGVSIKSAAHTSSPAPRNERRSGYMCHRPRREIGNLFKLDVKVYCFEIWEGELMGLNNFEEIKTFGKSCWTCTVHMFKQQVKDLLNLMPDEL